MRNATDAAPGELTAVEEESTQRNREVDLKTQRGDVVFFLPIQILRGHRLPAPGATAVARDSSVVNTLPVLSYRSTHKWIDVNRKMKDRKRMMMGRLPRCDVSDGDRRRCGACGARNIDAVCGGRRCLLRRRPGETRRGAHGVDLAAASIHGEEKAWCSCEASEVSPVPRCHRQ
jgi:hypothetical protein